MKAKKLIYVFVALVVMVAMLGIAAPAPTMAQSETKTIDVHEGSLTDHECDSTIWHFVINQLSDTSLAPATIHVIWANGAEADVPRGEPFESNIAHYSTTANLDSTVVAATAVIYAAWEGNFNLSHGPCDPNTPTPTNTPTTPTPTNTPTTPTPTETTTTPTYTPTAPTETPHDGETPTPTATEKKPGGSAPTSRTSGTAPLVLMGFGLLTGLFLFARKLIAVKKL